MYFQGYLVIDEEPFVRDHWKDGHERLLALGFVSTGDLAYRNDEGYYYVVGKKKFRILLST